MPKQGMANIWMARRFITELYSTYRQFFCPSVLPVSISSFMVLFMLLGEERLPVRIICRQLFMPRQQLTPILRKLVAAGYVKKNPSAADRRCMMVALTEQGRQVVQLYWENLCQQFAEHKKKEVHSFDF